MYQWGRFDGRGILLFFCVFVFDLIVVVFDLTLISWKISFIRYECVGFHFPQLFRQDAATRSTMTTRDDRFGR
tara:strand:+ start:3484 stop:3702 length:219 start_codon:yes stop_codon:yes gene_type:complete